MTILLITFTAMAIFSALPNFWTLPTKFLTGAARRRASRSSTPSATSLGFSAPYVTGLVRT